jgi:hypothetical protein
MNTNQPQSCTVLQRSDATFAVGVTGTEPLSYQWRFGGVDIPGARAAQYTRPAVQPADAGEYTVAISNQACLVISRPAVLTVTPGGSAHFDCTTNSGNITITGYTGPGGHVTIPDTLNGLPLTAIGPWAFVSCVDLTSLTLPDSITSIGDQAFQECTSLAAVYSQGNAPSLGYEAFLVADNATIYRLPGSTGWSTTLGDRPTALWQLSYPVILSFAPGFGIQTNHFGFIISWATNASVAVEASTNLAATAWSPVGTNILTDGWSYFRDRRWTNYPTRLYRLRAP